MEIKSLRGITFDSIFVAFSKAFEDYEIQLDKEQLKTMLYRRGFVPELSFAAFEGDDIAAFTLNGIGEYDGTKTAYDTGTGTIKEFRGKGLASEIFNYSIPYLKEENISQYLLEVLQHNTKAVSVYKKLGFEVSREFNYSFQKNDGVKIEFPKQDTNYTIAQVELSLCRESQHFGDFYPSWQNSFEAVARKPEDFVILGVYSGQSLAGYCIFEPTSGDVTQVAVDKQFRRKGAASLLLKEALKYNRHDSIKVVNTDVNCISITEFLKSVNVPIAGKQFEMIKKL